MPDVSSLLRAARVCPTLIGSQLSVPSAAATLDLITPALYPHPKLPWAPQPPGACRQHHCTDTSSEDIDKHPAVGPCAAVPGFRAGQDLLTDAGKALNAEQP